MFEYVLTVFALIAVLMIPGPTNAMLAYAAQPSQTKKALSLIFTVFIGYLYAIALWRLLINLTVDIWPAWSDILFFISILYVFWLAIRLWKMESTDELNQNFKNTSKSKLFYSLLKSPKPLLFAVGILPESTWQSFNHYIFTMAFLGLIMIPCVLFWIIYGQNILKGRIKRFEQAQLYKSSALFLVVCMLAIIIRFFV